MILKYSRRILNILVWRRNFGTFGGLFITSNTVTGVFIFLQTRYSVLLNSVPPGVYFSPGSGEALCLVPPPPLFCFFENCPPLWNFGQIKPIFLQDHLRTLPSPDPDIDQFFFGKEIIFEGGTGPKVTDCLSVTAGRKLKKLQIWPSV